MKLIRVYYAGKLAENEAIILSSQASHHVLVVLRLKVGATLRVFNGEGREYLAALTDVANKRATVSVLAEQKVKRESNLNVELVQGISRGERMDYVMQKSVELGVNTITPLFTARCEVKLSGERLQKRLAHWRSIILNACEQSGRLCVPTLNAPLTIDRYLLQPKCGLKLICAPEGKSVDNKGAPHQVVVMVGPEGGFTEEEVLQAKASTYFALRLGPRVLRTETAAVVALAVVQARWGDLA